MSLYTNPDFPEKSLPFLCHRDGLQRLLLGVKQRKDVPNKSPPGRITFESDIFRLLDKLVSVLPVHVYVHDKSNKVGRLVPSLFAKLLAQVVSHAAENIKDSLLLISNHQPNTVQDEFNRRIECSQGEMQGEVILANVGDTESHIGLQPVAENAPQVAKERKEYDIFQKKNGQIWRHTSFHGIDFESLDFIKSADRLPRLAEPDIAMGPGRPGFYIPFKIGLLEDVFLILIVLRRTFLRMEPLL